MARIAIVGSNSFSGSHFVDHCLSEGHETLALSRSAAPQRAFLPYLWREDSNTVRLKCFQARLPEDGEYIGSLLIEFAPDYVVNFAALGMVAESWQFPTDYYRTNVVGNVVLHEILRKLPSLHKYVHVSTPEVYGHTEGYITENAPLNPTTPYAASRAACDMHLKTFWQHHGFPVVWTRAANVFGPGQQLYRIVPRTLLAGFTGKKLQLHGGGASERSFIHIRDVCRATLTLAKDGAPGEIYHIATRETVTIRNLVERICELAGWEFGDIVETAPERPGKDAAYFLESRKIREAFEWCDQISLGDGILETKRWVEQYLPELSELPLDYRHLA